MDTSDPSIPMDSTQATATGASASGAPLRPPLLSLDQTEEAISRLLDHASTITSALSKVDPDAVSECEPAANQFYGSLRLIYASLLSQIRSHAGELAHLNNPVAATAATATGSSSGAAAAAVTAHEYRRNVYLDRQAMQLMLNQMNLFKDRIDASSTAIESLEKSS